jgi:hypothetical protein
MMYDVHYEVTSMNEEKTILLGKNLIFLLVAYAAL